MEETPFISQKLTKFETSHHLNNHRSSFPRCNNTKNHHPDTPAAAQVSFRMLCHVHAAGGVIGSSGSIIRHLETLTGSKIRFEEGLPNCHERVINIMGDAAVEKKISVGGGEENKMVDVSKAQEGLMRVFERVLEVEGNSGNNENEDISNEYLSIGCRLLAQTGQIGAVMGKGGKIVDGIRKSSGAKIRVLNKEQLPACANPEEELIQIMGGIVSVKKALLAVTRCLQDRTLGEGAPVHLSSHGVYQKSHADFSPKSSPKSSLSFPGSAIEHHSVGHFLSADVEKILNLNEDSSLRKVMFRILCSNGVAGGVIGKGANIVKSLEKETGASIKFASPVSGSKERVAIISALENPDPLYSPAQIATIRVFARCMEVCLDQRMISGLCSGESVSARILVKSSQVSCLLDEGGRVASDVSIASGAEIQLLGADLPKCAEVDDNVVQITSDYENVKNALFQLIGRFRESFFSGHAPNGADCRGTQLKRLPYIDRFDDLGFVHKSSTSYLPGLQLERENSRVSIPELVDNFQGLTTITSGLKHESNVGQEEMKQTVDVVVPGEVFSFVYGENGSNLVRLREISGATIILQDPCCGESSGKVIISGSPERNQIALSLLHAFISL